MPIRRGDGTSISPKGYQEVRLGDGTVLWSSDGQTGGGGEYTLPDKQNLAARWDFATVSETEGAEYTTVPDLSGNGHDLTGQGATHTENGINGHPSAQFDGSSASLEGPPTNELDIGSPTTAASVYLTYQAGSMDNVGTPLSQTKNGISSDREFQILFAGTVNQLRYFIGGERTLASTQLDTDPHMSAALYDRASGSATVSYDGATTTGTTGSAQVASDPPSLYIGARDDLSGTAAHFNGMVGEVLVYDTDHDIATHDEVMNYLSRWMSEGDWSDPYDPSLPYEDGLVVHFDAAALGENYGYSDGDPVDLWADESGNGYNATEVNSGENPIYRENELNGHGVVHFDETTWLKTNPLDTWISQPVTHIVIWSLNAESTEEWTYAFDRVNEADESHHHIWQDGTQEMRYYGGEYTVFQEPITKPSDYAVYTGVLDSGTGYRYYNGEFDGSSACGTNQFTGLTLGGRFNEPRLHGQIAEVVTFDHALSDADRQAVENHLMTKWGLS